VLSVIGAGTIIYDIFTKNFRFGTNTLGVLLVALFVLILGMLADAIVQHTRGMREVRPATRSEGTQHAVRRNVAS
jgi:hypothetical protein